MTRRLLAGALVVLVLAAPAGAVTVSVDRSQIATSLGHKFSFTTTITNRASAATKALIAHLNVLSLRPGTYVDPEDWSSYRTRYLGTIRAGGSRTLTWRLDPFNSGRLAVYVAVLPQAGSSGPAVTAPVIQVTVAARRTLNSGGILPLALGLPFALALLAGTVRLRRRSR
jgi:hypothetical protein